MLIEIASICWLTDSDDEKMLGRHTVDSADTGSDLGLPVDAVSRGGMCSLWKFRKNQNKLKNIKQQHCQSHLNFTTHKVYIPHHCHTTFYRCLSDLLTPSHRTLTFSTIFHPIHTLSRPYPPSPSSSLPIHSLPTTPPCIIITTEKIQITMFFPICSFPPQSPLPSHDNLQSKVQNQAIPLLSLVAEIQWLMTMHDVVELRERLFWCWGVLGPSELMQTHRK